MATAKQLKDLHEFFVKNNIILHIFHKNASTTVYDDNRYLTYCRMYSLELDHKRDICVRIDVHGDQYLYNFVIINIDDDMEIKISLVKLIKRLKKIPEKESSLRDNDDTLKEKGWILQILKNSCKEHCSICLKDITNLNKRLKCSHSFHPNCINKWSGTFIADFPCPFCRTIIPSCNKIVDSDSSESSDSSDFDFDF